MSASFPHDDLARWLDQATYGLPPSVVSTIRAELTGHVEDAVADLVQQGVPQPEAYRRAVAALGDPRTVGGRFNDVHRGHRCYKAALFASLATFLVGFGFSWLYKALDIVDYSTASRFLYAVEHILFVVLTVFIVVSLKRLLVWRYDNQRVGTPAQIILGGAGLYLVGNVILEFTIDSWDPVPRAFEASNLVEGICLGIMHGGLLIIWGGMVLFGVRALSTRNGLLRASVMIAIPLGMLSIISLILMYVGSDWSYVFGETSLLFSLFFWPMMSLVFFQASHAPHRLPIQTA